MVEIRYFPLCCSPSQNSPPPGSCIEFAEIRFSDMRKNVHHPYTAIRDNRRLDKHAALIHRLESLTCSAPLPASAQSLQRERIGAVHPMGDATRDAQPGPPL